MLTDGPEKFITRFSDDDYERATQMLVSIMNEVFQPSSWLVLPEEGRYQHATDEDGAKAMGSTFKSAQELFEIIWQLYIDENKLDDSQTDANQLDEETRQILSDVDVVWISALNKVETFDDEHRSSTTTGQTSNIKLMSI